MEKRTQTAAPRTLEMKGSVVAWLVGAMLIGSFIIIAAGHQAAPPTAAPMAANDVIYSSPHSYSKPVAQTKKVKLNQPTPAFTMTDICGRSHQISAWKGKLVLLFFADLSCPCVQAYNDRMKALQQKYASRGLNIAYIFPAPEDKPSAIAQLAQQKVYNWMCVRDTDQSLMKMFNAQCTTEAFLLDRAGVLRYHGRVDDSTFEPESVKAPDLENAIRALLNKQPIKVAETQAFACTIPRLRPEDSNQEGKT